MWQLTDVSVGFVAFALAAYFFYYNYSNRKAYNLPPGPWGLPIFGHILFFGNNPAQKFLEWKQIYGPIFTVRFGSIQTVVLNDARLIKEAFNMYEFSGRPLLPLLNEMSNKKGIITADGPKQVEQKKFSVKTMREFGVGSRSMEQRQQEETLNLVTSLKLKIKELKGKPLKMNKMFRFAIINSFWDSIMGGRFEENDPALSYLIKCIDQGTDTNSTLIAQLFWFFPWVAKLGNTVGYNPPLHAFRSIYKFMEREIFKFKQAYVKSQPKNFCDAYFDKVAATTDLFSSFYESDNQQAFTFGDLFMAAIDSSVNIIDWLMIYMAREPKIQETLQDEIENTIGVDKSRMPCLSDRSNMPYTNAVIDELLRVTTALPFGFFHRTTIDVEFKGYKIPKDTMVISNLYAVHRDPEVWQSPEKFDPTRFLDKKGQLHNTKKSEFLPFGIGRRVCIGEGFARDILFLLITNFFREFVVSCTENIPPLESVFGVVLCPLPFELNVKESLGRKHLPTTLLNK